MLHKEPTAALLSAQEAGEREGADAAGGQRNLSRELQLAGEMPANYSLEGEGLRSLLS